MTRQVSQKRVKVLWRLTRLKFVSRSWWKIKAFTDNATSWEARDWKKITLVMIAFAIIGYLIAFFYVFVFGGLDFDRRARAVTPFLVGLAGAATFFSILWRGEINAKQADEARRANDSKDEVELGLLLEKAHEFLLKPNGTGTTLALTMLETVACANNGKYSSYALDLVAEEAIDAHHGSMSNDKSFRDENQRRALQVRRIFSNAASLQPPRRLSHRASFVFPRGQTSTVPSLNFVEFSPIPEIEDQVIENAKIYLDAVSLGVLNEPDRRIQLNNCLLIGWATDLTARRPSPILRNLDGRFKSCVFSNLRIRGIETQIGLLSPPKMSMATDCSFDSCDFTGVEMSKSFLGNNKFSKCTYILGHPPILVGESEGAFEDFVAVQDIDIRQEEPFAFGSIYGLGTNPNA